MFFVFAPRFFCSIFQKAFYWFWPKHYCFTKFCCDKFRMISSYFFYSGACFSKAVLNMLIKASRINSCKLCFVKLKEISSINLFLPKLVYFLYVTIIGVCLGEYDFITGTINLWKRDKPVSTSVDFRKLFCEFVENGSIHDAFFW